MQKRLFKKRPWYSYKCRACCESYESTRFDSLFCGPTCRKAFNRQFPGVRAEPRKPQEILAASARYRHEQSDLLTVKSRTGNSDASA